MLRKQLSKAPFGAVPIAMATNIAANQSHAHEAWLLTPAEIEALAHEPMPAIFASSTVLGTAALVAGLITIAALYIEERLSPFEAQIAPALRKHATDIGPAILRIALSIMIGLAATGGLPRHGVSPWIQPTFLVPDMQLTLLPGWDWLIALQLAVATFLMIGLYTRLMGIIMIGMSVLGLIAFGSGFWSYTPHFAAPGLILLLTGGGRFSTDKILGLDHYLVARRPQILWQAAQFLVGAGFVYLAVAYKLTQPTLLIAILQHGNLPTFGLPYAWIALIMTGVEIICGGLLITGRLVRPVSLTIIGAITFLAVTLGETPLFHANLYGSMIIFVLMGRNWTTTSSQSTSTFGKAMA